MIHAVNPGPGSPILDNTYVMVRATSFLPGIDRIVSSWTSGVC